MTAATIGYQPPAAGRRPGTGTWHAVVTATVKVGWVTREAGEALCGLVPLADPPPVLFLAVTCRACLAIAAREPSTSPEDSYEDPSVGHRGRVPACC